jgi:hypothetical protein
MRGADPPFDIDLDIERRRTIAGEHVLHRDARHRDRTDRAPVRHAVAEYGARVRVGAAQHQLEGSRLVEVAALTHISCPDAISVANFYGVLHQLRIRLHRDYPISGLQVVRRIRAVVHADIENNIHSVFLPRSGSRTSICRQSSDCRPDKPDGSGSPQAYEYDRLD